MMSAPTSGGTRQSTKATTEMREENAVASEKRVTTSQRCRSAVSGPTYGL